MTPSSRNGWLCSSRMLLLCLGWLCLTLFRVAAAPDHLGQQRYLIYNIWSWTAQEEFAQFKAQADAAQRAGFNAIKVYTLINESAASIGK